MSTQYEKSPATAPTVNGGMELGKRSAQQSTQVQEEPKPVVYHLALNFRKVQEGKDKTVQIMCGKSIATRNATRSRSRASVQNSPKAVLCSDCEFLRDLEGGFK